MSFVWDRGSASFVSMVSHVPLPGSDMGNSVIILVALMFMSNNKQPKRNSPSVSFHKLSSQKKVEIPLSVMISTSKVALCGLALH